MNLKNLKNLDYKTLALQYCDKAGVAVASCLLVLFLLFGLQKAAAKAKIKPEELTQLARKVQDSVTSPASPQYTKWSDAIAQKEGVVNPDLRGAVAKLQSRLEVGDFTWLQPFWHFIDFGSKLRGQPEILVAYDPRVYRDRHGVFICEVDANGEIIWEEVKPKRPLGEKKEKKEKKPGTKGKVELAKGAAPKAGRMGRMSGMMGSSAMGRMGDASMYDSGMSLAGMSGMDDDGGDMSEMQMMNQLGAMRGRGGDVAQSQIARGAPNQRRQSKRDIFMEEEEDAPPPDPKAAGKAGQGAQTKMLPKEKVVGLRWVVITAMFPHMDQVKKFEEALHKKEHPEGYEDPDYHSVRVQRRELLSDETFSEWAEIDYKRMREEVTDKLPGRVYDEHDPPLRPSRWDPEDDWRHREMVRAGAIFDRLVMKLPELATGAWERVDRLEAWKAVHKPSSTAPAAGGRGVMPIGEDQSEEAMRESSEEEDEPDQSAEGLFSGSPGRGNYGEMMRSMSSQQPQMREGGMGAGMMQRGTQPGTQRAPTFSGVSKASAKRIQHTKAEVVQIRFIDYTVEPEHTYQYRLKVVLNNPNYERPDVANDEFATPKTLESDWSEPTPHVYVPPDKEYYFVERISRRREEAKLEVHTWIQELGDWALASFSVKPGDTIGAPKRDVDMVDWNENKTKRSVDFSTDDLLVDITGGDRVFSVERDGRMVPYGEDLPAEVLIVDRYGDLVSRNEEADRIDVNRKTRADIYNELVGSAKKKDDKKEKGKPETGKKEDFEDERVPKRREGAE
jgi:hypothetical protein